MDDNKTSTSVFLTTTEAAAILGMTDSGIRRLIQRGKLPATLYGKTYLINRRDLAQVTKSQAGRPRKSE